MTGILETVIGRAWRPMVFGTRRYMAREIYNFLNSLDILSSLHLRFTSYPWETALLINSLHHWWNDKLFTAHRSHLRNHKPFCNLSRREISFTEKVARDLPGAGIERAASIAQKFPTVSNMVRANEKDWESIDGIGKTLAKKYVRLFRGD